MLTRTEINLIAEKTAELVLSKSDELLSAKQCAERLGISTDALYSRVHRQQIPHKKKHDTLYFSWNEVKEYYLMKK